MNFRDYLILENTTKQARNYVEKEIGLNYDQELTIGGWIDSEKEMILWEVIDLCKLPVKIPNISKKGNNNLDLVYLLTYLSFKESKILFSTVDLSNYLEFEIKDKERKYTWDQFLEILENHKRDTEVIDQNYLDNNLETEGKWDLDNIVAYLLKYNQHLNLLPLGNPSAMSIRQFREKYKTRLDYGVSEYLHDYLVIWLPKRLEANRWIKNLPSNIRSGFRDNLKHMNALIDVLTSFNNLSRINIDEIWNTYFIKEEGDRGIIRRFNSSEQFLKDFNTRIKEIKGGRKEVYGKIESLGNSVKTVYDKGDVLVVLVKNYGASQVLGCDTSWCISTTEHQWENYNGKDTLNVQYFIYDFSKPSEDIKSRIGVTIKRDGSIRASHFKDDSEIYEEETWNYLKRGVGLSNPRKILKPISKKYLDAIERAKSKQEQAERIITDASNRLGDFGKITGTEHQKKIEKLINSDYFKDLDISKVKKQLTAVLLVLKKFDLMESLHIQKRITLTRNHVIYLLKKEYYDLAKKILPTLNYRNFEDFQNLFIEISKIESNDVYDEFFKLIDIEYYEYSGSYLGSTKRENDKELDQPIRGMADNYFNTRNIERLEDLIKRVPTINLRNYSSDELNSTNAIDYFIFRRTKSETKKLVEEDYKFIEWLFSKECYTKKGYNNLLFYNENREIFNKNLEFMNSTEKEDIADYMFVTVVDNKKEVTIEKLKDFINLGADVKAIKDYRLETIMSKDYDTKVLRYLIDKGVDISNYDTGSRHRDFSYNNLIYHFKDDVKYLKSLITMIDFTSRQEGNMRIVRNYTRPFLVELLNTFAGSEHLRGLVKLMNFTDTAIPNEFTEYMKDHKDATDKEIEEIIDLDSLKGFKVITTEVLSFLNNEKPDLYTLAKSYSKSEDTWESFKEVLKTENMNLINPVISPEVIEKYGDNLRNDRYFIGLYITNYKIFKKLIDNGYKFSERNFKSILEHGVEKIKSEDISRMFDLLTSQGMELGTDVKVGTRSYSDKTIFHQIFKTGNVSLIRKMMDPHKDEDLKKWGGIYTTTYTSGRSNSYGGQTTKYVTKHWFDKILKSNVDVIKYFVEEIGFLDKLNEFTLPINVRTNAQEHFKIDLSEIVPDREYSSYKISKEKLNYLYNIHLESERGDDKYNNIIFKLDLSEWTLVVADDFSLVKYVVEELGADVTDVMYKMCTGSHKNYYRNQKYGDLETLEYLHKKGADIDYIYEEEKQSNQLSLIARDYLKSHRGEVKESKLFNYQQFKDFDI